VQMELSMQQFSKKGARPRVRRALVSLAAGLLGASLLCQPNFAYARGGGGGHGGGGFHAGGFHSGGFHGGGFHAGGSHSGGFHGGGFHAGGSHGRFASVHNGFGDGHGGHWYHGWRNGRYGWWLWGPGLAWTLYPYASQSWYCSDPAGYYPYVTQCSTGWQSAPAS